MFTGIVEKVTEIIGIEQKGTNKIFTLANPYGDEIYIDQSISHNGVCLTVIEFTVNEYKVEAIQETLLKSNLGSLHIGDKVNLERSLLPHSRVDGHFVQGHVDSTGTLQKIEDKDGSWLLTIRYPSEFELYLIPKGSVCLNGISLTIANLDNDTFQVAIIPYTFEHTNLNTLKVGADMNIEYDSLGKYVVNYLKKTNS